MTGGCTEQGLSTLPALAREVDRQLAGEGSGNVSPLCAAP